MIFVRLARREPGGAKGLLESMAAGNTEWYRPLRMERKPKFNIVLHRSNGKARQDPQQIIQRLPERSVCFAKRSKHRVEGPYNHNRSRKACRSASTPSLLTS
jgi:hypothetical protein